MKQLQKTIFPLILALILVLSTGMTVLATGEGNIDGGGGGMGSGTKTDVWHSQDGVRVTVVTTSGSVASTPFDLTNSSIPNATINFGLYPDGIFKGAVKFLLYYVIPTGMMIYKPVRIMTEPDLGGLAVVAGYAFLLLAVAVTVFYRGLKRYSSGNLMSARV